MLDKYTYGYDNNSNRTYRKNLSTTGLDELYGYDNLNRLTSLQRGTLSADHSSISSQLNAEGFGPDFLGNMSSYTVSTGVSLLLNQSRTVNPINEITGISTGYGTAWATPSYDANGNMTVMPRPGNESSSLTVIYDAWNRQVSVTDSTGATSKYVFDGLNHRVAKAVPNGSNWMRTDFYYNQSWQTVEERQYTTAQSSSTTVASSAYCVYIWDLRYIDAPVCRLRSTAHNGTLDETLYYCNDANFHTTAVVSLTGAVVERYSYDAYGKPTFYDGAWNRINGSAYDNQILICGYRYDPETGLYHVRIRMYNPAFGIWTSCDPLGYIFGMNIYQYVQCNPNTWTDPMGLQAQPLPSQPSTNPTSPYPRIAPGTEPGVGPEVGPGKIDIPGKPGLAALAAWYAWELLFGRGGLLSGSEIEPETIPNAPPVTDCKTRQRFCTNLRYSADAEDCNPRCGDKTS